MKLLTNLDLSRNEIKNVVIHNLPSHPSEQKEGQVYFNTSQNQHYAYRNGKWTVLGSDSIADIIGLQDALDSKSSIENEHNHKNKAILDGIDKDRVAKWDNSVEDAKGYTDAQILEINGGAPSSSNSLKKISDILDAHKESIDTLDALAKTKADDEEIKSILATKANLVEVNNKLSAKADAETVNSELEKKALKSVVEQMNVDLSNAINTKMDIHAHPYKSENWYPTWNDVTDKPTIPTKVSQLTNDSKFITTIPSEYVTEAELNAKGYSTFNGDYNNLTNKPTIPSISGLASESYVNEYVENAIKDIPKEEVDLSNYAKKTELPTKLSQLANDKGYITSIPSEYVTESELNSKGYLTEHQDISGKLDKNLGIENFGKILSVGTDGSIILIDMPSSDIAGVVDDNNNIILSGYLAEGTYVLKYVNEDGTYSDVGTLVVGTIEPKPEPEPFEGNLFDLETTKINTRFSSSGAEKDQNGVWLSDFIPFDINVHHTLYVKNAIMKRDVTSQPGPSVVFFDENKAYIGILYCTPALANYNNWAYKISDDYYKVVFNVSEIITSSYWKNTKYIKVSGVESEAGNFIVKNDIKDVIITLNTPIEDEGTQEPNPDSPTIIEGNLFNLDTVQLNTKISGTSGSISTQNGAWLTDLIAINITDISSLYVKNAMMRQDGTTAAPSPLLTFHDSNGTMLGCLRCNGAHASYQEYVEIISENYTKIDFTHTILTSSPWYSNVKYMRVNGVENPNGTSISSKNDIADVIIKINEGIE